jgi:hypothetical protein
MWMELSRVDVSSNALKKANHSRPHHQKDLDSTSPGRAANEFPTKAFVVSHCLVRASISDNTLIVTGLIRALGRAGETSVDASIDSIKTRDILHIDEKTSHRGELIGEPEVGECNGPVSWEEKAPEPTNKP